MKARTKIRILLVLFITLLILSGITAFPIEPEIDFLYENRSVFPELMNNWLTELKAGVEKTPPLLFYGTDWLAFAHIIISLFFIPVYLDPEKHIINLRIGILACLLVFPLAFICGPVRGIPFFHQLIDCSFGIIGFLFLFYVLKLVKKTSYEES